jgi:Tfp pilus assembly protein PilX
MQFLQRHGQQGTVLIVGLVFLFAMSVVSITSLSGVVTQERRASNSDAKNQAEHAALSAITEFQKLYDACNASIATNINDAIEAGAGNLKGPVTVTVPNGGYKAEVSVRLIQTVDNKVNSLDADLSASNLTTPHVEILARGSSTTNPDVKVEIRRGFVLNGTTCDS